MRINRKIHAISLVEVMIAIYIFGVGILVILRMLVSNISRLYDIKIKDTAVSLAKESMDIIYHMRDSNMEKGMSRDCASVVYSGWSWICAYSLLSSASWSFFTVSWTVTGLYTLDQLVSTGDAQVSLYYHTGELYALSWTSYTWFRYNHDASNGQETYFSRWIEVYPVDVYSSYTWYVLRVRSVVEYMKWSRSRQVFLESIIGDIR